MSIDKFRIFDKMIEGVQIIDPEWRYLYVNETVTAHGKHTEEELLGHTMMEMYPGIETTEMYSQLKKCMTGGSSYSMVNEFDFPDGSKGYFELRMQRIDEGVLVFSYDITEVKRAEQLIRETNKKLEKEVKTRTNELEESEQRFELAVAGTSAGVWDWVDIESDKEWWSPKFYELLGYENLEIPPSLESFKKIVHPDDYEKTMELLNKHLEKHKKFEIEYRLKTKKGEYKWFLGSGQAEWNKDGTPKRMVGTIVDIDQKKKAEKLLKERSKQLEQKNKELQEFVYIASHDLQEPVRTIASMVNLFTTSYRDLVDEDGMQVLNYMKGAADRSQNLIVDLLDYSRIGSKRAPEELDFNAIIEEVKVDLSSQIKEKKAVINTNTLPHILGLKTETRLLFQNLIGNAIKFSRLNEVPVIDVNAEKVNDEGCWLFSVKDNGIGFNGTKFGEKIFEVFKRLNNRRDYEGTGIGLAQCKRIVELYGGKIWAESELGKGSTFYFTIPEKVVIAR